MGFYSTILIIALVALILVMTYIGISLYRNRKTANFPSNYANCPDYWQQDADGNCIIPAAKSVNTRNTYETDPKFVVSGNTINFK